MQRETIVSAARRGLHRELAQSIAQERCRTDPAAFACSLNAAAYAAAAAGQDLALDVLFDAGADETHAIAWHAVASAAHWVWATRALGLRVRVIALEQQLFAGDDAGVGAFLSALLKPRDVADWQDDDHRRSLPRRHAFAVRLVQAGAANAVVPNAASLLHLAVDVDAVAVVEALVAAGVTPVVPDATGRTALRLAAERRSVALVQQLLRAWPDGTLPPEVAAAESLPPVRGLHAASPLPFNAPFFDEDYENPAIDLLVAAGVRWRMDWACARGAHQVVLALLRAGESATTPNAYRLFPLQLAAGWAGYEAYRALLVATLLAAGARPDAAVAEVQQQGEVRPAPWPSAVEAAAVRGRWVIVRMLVAAGARSVPMHGEARQA